MGDSGESSVRALLERVIDEIGVVVTHKGWCVCEREGWREKREREEGESRGRESSEERGERRGREGCRKEGEEYNVRERTGK